MTVQQETIQKIKAFSLMNETHQLAIIGQHSSKKLKSLCSILSTSTSTTSQPLLESSTNPLFLKIKALLLLWGPPTLSRNLMRAVDDSQVLITDSVLEQTEKLTTNIKSRLIRLRVNEKGDRLALSRIFKQLRDIYISTSTNTKDPMKQFYKNLEVKCGCSKRTIQNHIAYLDFLTKFQRFQLAIVSFTELVRIIELIKIWFISEECSLLSPNNYSSEAFWLHAASDVNAQVQLPALDVNPVSDILKELSLE
jgi:hypothetical protein